LRLGDGEAIPLGGLLPDGQLSAAAALMAARPGWSRALNLLPAAQRAVVSRWPYVPAAVLAGVLALLTAALAAFPQIEERRLAATLREETARWEQSAVKSRQLEADRQKLLARAGQLNGFRQRTRQDLEALMEATRLIPAPAWAGRLDLTRTTIAIAGEAGQATELLQKFDQSPLFRNSEFVAPLSRSRDSAFDNFQLRAQREERQ
jgi:Tfp pilus assembly protein PilN